MKKKCVASALIVAVILIGFWFMCSRVGHKEVTKSGFYFDTIIQITLYRGTMSNGTRSHGEEALLDDCFQMADRYENYFSTTKKNSDIAKINAAGGKPVKVHSETRSLIKKGLEYGEKSDGKFDITIGRLSSLWDFSKNEGEVPAKDEIEKALKTVNYKKVKIEGDRVVLEDPNAQLDLGGIAKGYIADQMKAYLVKNGVKQGIINLGGNVLTIGEKKDKEGYHIGIRKPFDETGATIAEVEVKDQTVVSSGVYERFFYKGNKLYHHLLDTKTGYPIENDLLGVTIICNRSVDGDALSTTAFALGLEDGMHYIESLDGVRAAFVTKDDQVHWTT